MTFANNEILLYNLANRPASFDFVTCLATATALGVRHVRFVLNQGFKKKDYHDPVDRFISIVEPACELYGLDYSVGEPKGVEIPHILKYATQCFKETGKIGKIKGQCNAEGYITITLRKSRCPERNSKDDEWQKFADRCGEKVVILEDSAPVKLSDRYRLYAKAKMNFFVMNGPATLCFHSDAPYIVMRTIGGANSGSTSPESSKANGIYPGFQFPWANENQRLSYLDDTYQNIMSEWMRVEEKAA